MSTTATGVAARRSPRKATGGKAAELRAKGLSHAAEQPEYMKDLRQRTQANEKAGRRGRNAAPSKNATPVPASRAATTDAEINHSDIDMDGENHSSDAYEPPGHSSSAGKDDEEDVHVTSDIDVDDGPGSVDEPEIVELPQPKPVIAEFFLPRKTQATTDTTNKRTADAAGLDSGAKKAKKPKTVRTTGAKASERTSKAKKPQSERAPPLQPSQVDLTEEADEEAEEEEEEKEKSGRTRSTIKLFYKHLDTITQTKLGPKKLSYTCIHCRVTVKAGSDGSTGNLGTHLRKEHLDFAKLLDRMNQVVKDKGFGSIPEDWIKKAGTKGADLTEFFPKDNAPRPVVEPFNQKTWEEKLLTWMVVSDQPFTEVENLELRACLRYLRADVNIPKADTIRARIMEMGAGLDGELKAYFADIQTKIHIALDAWTSSNGYAFMAITGHFIKNNTELEEILLDFVELSGKHSGENLAQATFETLKRLGILEKLGNVTTDNASNNITLLTTLAKLMRELGAQPDYDAKQRHIRCMAHVIHLAALALLYSMGAFKPDTRTEDLDTEYRNELEVMNATEEALEALADLEASKEDAETAASNANATHAGVPPVVGPDAVSNDVNLGAIIKKLRELVKKIKNSPQKRQRFNRIILEHRDSVLRLILDVKTRWSSTQRMFERCLALKDALTEMCASDGDLKGFSLTEAEWTAVETVSQWLYWFRVALEELEKTTKPTLAMTIPIFNGLQTQLEALYTELKYTANHSPALLHGLADSHKKLAKYYMETDSSFFYTWAALLDPRLKEAYFKDSDVFIPYTAWIDTCVLELGKYFEANYAPTVAPSGPSIPKKTSGNGLFSGVFVSSKRQSLIDQYHDYMRSAREDEETDVLIYWASKSPVWPDLARLARDILCIPATAVSVERIFSGGRDTISLRRASLSPETITALMRLKSWFRMLRDEEAKKPIEF